jgi:hypothetical protein
MKLKVIKSPNENAALTNAVFCHPNLLKSSYIEVRTSEHPTHSFFFTLLEDSKIPSDSIGNYRPIGFSSKFMYINYTAFSYHQRNWAELALNVEVDVFPFDISKYKNGNYYLKHINLEVELFFSA